MRLQGYARKNSEWGTLFEDREDRLRRSEKVIDTSQINCIIYA